MDESKPAGRTFGLILFVIFAAISVYYIYLGYGFIKFVIEDAQLSSINFYEKFPSVLWHGILESILGTVIIIVLSIKQLIYNFTEEKKSRTISVALTSVVLVLMAASEILFYRSINILMGGGYSMLDHLRSYLSTSGIARVFILLFLVFYLIYSIVLTSNAGQTSRVYTE